MSLVSDLLDSAAKAASGVQEFSIAVGSEARAVRIEINPDADSILRIRAKASDYAFKAGGDFPPAWAQWVGAEISTNIATRIAYAEGCKVAIYPREGGEPERITALDLLKMARRAGGIFMVLTDEILGRVNGLNLSMEVEVVTKLGEDLPQTTGDSSS